MQAQTAPIAPEIALCDHEGCNDPAVFSYTWEWGEAGKCCAKHQFVLTQTASSLERRINFVPLAGGVAPPLQREERVRLIAEKLATEEELTETKSRGLDLYNQNVALTQQLQAVTVRERETSAQLKDARAEVENLRGELTKRLAEHGDLADEVSRLRTLVQRPPPPKVEELTSQLASAKASIDGLQDMLEEQGSELRRLRELAGEPATGAERSSVGLSPEAAEPPKPKPKK